MHPTPSPPQSSPPRDRDVDDGRDDDGRDDDYDEELAALEDRLALRGSARDESRPPPGPVASTPPSVGGGAPLTTPAAVRAERRTRGGYPPTKLGGRIVGARPPGRSGSDRSAFAAVAGGRPGSIRGTGEARRRRPPLMTRGGRVERSPSLSPPLRPRMPSLMPFASTIAEGCGYHRGPSFGPTMGKTAVTPVRRHHRKGGDNSDDGGNGRDVGFFLAAPSALLPRLPPSHAPPRRIIRPMPAAAEDASPTTEPHAKTVPKQTPGFRAPYALAPPPPRTPAPPTVSYALAPLPPPPPPPPSSYSPVETPATPPTVSPAAGGVAPPPPPLRYLALPSLTRPQRRGLGPRKRRRDAIST